jgi:hypothetical protein
MALRQVLHKEPPIGSVSREGDQLVVVAPPGIHRGIPAFLKSLETAQSEVDRGSVEVDYWLVVGTPSQDAPDVEAFGELGATLDEIVKSQGPMRFRVLEQLTLSSVVGDSGESRGSIGRVRQQVDLSGDRILIDADVQFHDGGHIGLNNTGLKTRYTLRPGQIGVMARSGYDENPKRGGADKDVRGATLFYVVRARLLQDPK